MYRICQDSICVVINAAKYTDDKQLTNYLNNTLRKKISTTEQHHFNQGRIIRRKILIIICSDKFFTNEGVLEVSKFCIVTKTQQFFVNNTEEAKRLVICCNQKLSSKSILDFSALQKNSKKNILVNMFTELMEKPNGYFKGRGFKLKDVINLFYNNEISKE